MRRPGQHLAFARRAAHPRTGADRAYKYTARAGFADNFPDRYNHLLLELDSMLRIVTSRLGEGRRAGNQRWVFAVRKFCDVYATTPRSQR